MGKKIIGVSANGLSGEGRVCIILGVSDFNKFRSGDIIVTRETLPVYFPLMVKSSGIITDAGGLLSHAAVVSREIKIPCIVGAKKATTILKDGELVYLDGGSGMVYPIYPISRNRDMAVD